MEAKLIAATAVPFQNTFLSIWQKFVYADLETFQFEIFRKMQRIFYIYLFWAKKPFKSQFR